MEKLGSMPEVVSCYEAGYDGFWLLRLLEAAGIRNFVFDAASIAVEQRARRTKTDKIDGELLLRTLMAHLRGEPRVVRIVRVPSVEAEDARRASRERDRLVTEQTAHTNRIKGLLRPAACRCALTMVESMTKYSRSGSSDIVSKIRRQTPLMLHRLKRRNTLFQSRTLPEGHARENLRTIHSTPSTNIRLSRPVEPFWSGRPIISGAIRSHAASRLPKEALNLICSRRESLESLPPTAA